MSLEHSVWTEGFLCKFLTDKQFRQWHGPEEEMHCHKNVTTTRDK